MTPVDPITVTAANGTIQTIQLLNPTGYLVKGTFSKDKTSWTTAEVLGYGKKYSLTGTATGTDGKTVPISGTYTVIKPSKQPRTTVYPTDGMTVGVAMPIEVKFPDVTPQDRALIEKHVSITTTPKVEGAWGWIHHNDGVWGLDFRTKNYWPENTKVHISANVYGLKFAAGAYGKSDVSSDFTIGRNQVVYADAATFKIVVKQDGKVTQTYPASYGLNADGRQTHSGIHVVSDIQPKTFMKSEPNSPYPPYQGWEYWTVRISSNGEFIHAQPGTAAEQGNANVSHGCVNLSTANAKAYYQTAILGDPVEVTGTSAKLSPSDGDVFDWTIPWNEWLGLSALRN